ncbi:tandem-type lipoprotein [Macrococcus capreoli]
MMFQIKKLMIMGVMTTMIISGCSSDSNQKEKGESDIEKKVEQHFEKHLSVYPTKNIEDFYDKEGFRDDQFEKNDKGMWVLISDITYPNKMTKEDQVEGVALYIYRNTRTIKGYYYEYNIEKFAEQNEKRYPLTVKNNQFVLLRDAPEKVKDTVNKFRFLIQDEKIGDLSKYEKLDFNYNANVPYYSSEYQLKSEHSVNKWIQNHYHIMKGDAILEVKGSGDLSGNSIGFVHINVNYNTKPNEPIKMLKESISYQPTKESIE